MLDTCNIFIMSKNLAVKLRLAQRYMLEKMYVIHKQFLVTLPALNDTPLCSSPILKMFLLRAPVPAVIESPRAATTSMSPGRSLCTLLGFLYRVSL